MSNLQRVPAILRFESKTPRAAGEEFFVESGVAEVFKVLGFGTITDAERVILLARTIGPEVISGGPVPMFTLVGMGVGQAWPAMAAGTRVRLTVRAVAPVDGFSCVLKGDTLGSNPDEVVDVTLSPIDG